MNSKWRTSAAILVVFTLTLMGFAYRNRQQSGSFEQTNHTEAELKLYYRYPDLESSVAALKKNPNDAAAYRGLAAHYSMNLNNAKTIESLRKTVELEPDNDHNKNLLAGSLQNDKQYAEAAKLFREIRPNSRESPGAKRMLDLMKSRGQIP